MKKRNTRLCLCLGLGSLSMVAGAQNANLVLSGTNLHWVNTGSVVAVLDNANLRNNASETAISPNNEGTLLFSGSDAAAAGGDFATAFHILSVNKPASELRLGTDATATGGVNLIAGDVNLQDATLDLGNTASIAGETYPDGNRLYCASDATGRIRAVRNLVTGTNNDIAGLGIDLSVTGIPPGNTVLYRGHQVQEDDEFTATGTSIGRYYDLEPAVAQGSVYSMVFRYHELDLGTVPEDNFVFYRSESFGVAPDWEEWGLENGPGSPGAPTVGLAVHGTSANAVSLEGINAYKRWTVSKPKLSNVGLTTQTATENGLAIYPNPAAEYFTVAVNSAQKHPDVALEVLDLTGKTVRSLRTALSEGGNEFAFDRAGMPSGIYIVRLRATALELNPIKLVIR